MWKELISLLIVPLVSVVLACIAFYQAVKIKRAEKDLEKMKNDFNEKIEKIKSDLMIDQKLKTDNITFISQDKKNKLNAFKEVTETIQAIKDNVINIAFKSVPSSLSKRSFEAIIEQHDQLLTQVYSKNASFFEKYQKDIIHPSKDVSTEVKRILLDDKNYQGGYLTIGQNIREELSLVKNRFTEIQNKITDFKVSIISL